MCICIAYLVVSLATAQSFLPFVRIDSLMVGKLVEQGCSEMRLSMA